MHMANQWLWTLPHPFLQRHPLEVGYEKNRLLIQEKSTSHGSRRRSLLPPLSYDAGANPQTSGFPRTRRVPARFGTTMARGPFHAWGGRTVERSAYHPDVEIRISSRFTARSLCRNRGPCWSARPPSLRCALRFGLLFSRFSVPPSLRGLSSHHQPVALLSRVLLGSLSTGGRHRSVAPY